MSEPVIRFEKLGHAYRLPHWIFRNYSGSIKRGSVFAVLGPNGCGKTTLLKLLLNEMPPREGAVSVQGRLAFVPQLFQSTFDYTALEMVLMGRFRHIGTFAMPSRKDQQAAFTCMDRLGISDLADQPFQELSGGQRQLVIFARALVSDAEVLILDEPASALDLKHQAMILEWIRNLADRDGLTIMFTTHHPQHADAVADHVLLMFGDDHHACGPAREVLTEMNLQRLYGLPIRRIRFEQEGETLETLAPVLTKNPVRG